MNRLSNIGEPLDKQENRLFHQNRHRAIFLRDLPYHFSDEHLRALVVSLLGGNEAAVDLCRVKYSSKNGKTLQIGIAMLRNEMDAQHVVRCLWRSPRHCGRDIRAYEFRQTNAVQPSNDGSLHFTFNVHFVNPLITEEIVRAHLEVLGGPLQSICIRGHFDTQHGQEGFGFCSFLQPSQNEKLVSTRSITIDHVLYCFHAVNPLGKGDSEDSQESTFLSECVSSSVSPSADDSRSTISAQMPQEYSCNTIVASAATMQHSMGPAVSPMESSLPPCILSPLPIINMNMNIGSSYPPILPCVAPMMMVPMLHPAMQAAGYRPLAMMQPADSCHAPQACRFNQGSPCGVAYMFPGGVYHASSLTKPMQPQFYQ